MNLTFAASFKRDSKSIWFWEPIRVKNSACPHLDRSIMLKEHILLYISVYAITIQCKWKLKKCAVAYSTLVLACVASVSVWVRSKERPRNGILGFGRARNETRAKKWKWGEGEEKEKNACRQTPRLCVDPRFVSYWEDGMVRDTYINFQWLLFILVGKIWYFNINTVHELQNTKKKTYFGFTYASSEVHFRSTERQRFYWSIKTADDSIKCWCAN